MRLISASCFAALAIVAAPAYATTTIQGQATNIALHTADPGLVVSGVPLSFGPLTLDLDPTSATPQSRAANVFSISSPESTVNLFEDTKPYEIAVSFAFGSPLGTTGSPVVGTTRGIYTLITRGFGNVTWGGPQTFTFGNGGAFSVSLRDTNFAINGATTNVVGDFRLISESVAAVPEPATWAMMLLGFGMAGAGLRSRRKQQAVRVTYA